MIPEVVRVRRRPLPCGRPGRALDGTQYLILPGNQGRKCKPGALRELKSQMKNVGDRKAVTITDLIP